MVEEKGKQAEERQDEPRLWRPWQPPRRRRGWRVVWAAWMVVAVLTTGLLIVDLRPEIWRKDLLEGRVPELVALGFSLTAIVVMLAIALAIAGARRSWTGFQGKTVWDFLQLLIVPLVLAVIGLWFATQQDARQQQFENQRAEAERKLVQQRAQDEALQAYLDQMNNLLLEHNLRDSEEDSEVRTLARARTLTVLGRLDSERNSAILQFLREAQLISGTDPVVRLSKSNLHDADLRGANLNGIHLSEADLRGADLSRANLSEADLSNAFLSNAFLSNADLRGAVLRGAVLSNADLYMANLSGAKGLTNEELLKQQVSFLEGATMPNGQKYEDWTKTKALECLDTSRHYQSLMYIELDASDTVHKKPCCIGPGLYGTSENTH
jgi:uncharacterized protein YjbI with pentapeptide repeats